MNHKETVACLLLTTVLTMPVGQAREAFEVIPAASNLVARINIAEIIASPLATEILAEKGAEYEIAKALLITVFGLDFEAIDTAWLLATGQEAYVLILQGRFNADTIAGRLSILPNIETREYKGVRHVSSFEEQQDGKTQRQLAAVLSDDLLAVGEEGNMIALLDVWRGQGPALSAKQPGLQRVIESDEHIAATILDLSRWPELDASTAALLNDVWMSADVTQDLETRLEFDASSLDAAKGIEHLIRGLLLLGLARPDIQAEPAMLHALETAQLARDDLEVTLLMAVPGEQLLESSRETTTEQVSTNQ